MNSSTRTITTSISIVTILLLSAACSSSGKSAKSMSPEDRAAATIKRFNWRDPGMSKFFDSAAGYAVFPSIAKGAIGIGGARGDGVVYEKGKVIGWSTLTQGTVGLQLGAQVYSEIIFFRDSAALAHFKTGNLEFNAQVSAIIASAGASADADYASGVVIFTMADTGVMFEASLGGQGFSFVPKE